MTLSIFIILFSLAGWMRSLSRKTTQERFRRQVTHILLMSLYYAEQKRPAPEKEAGLSAEKTDPLAKRINLGWIVVGIAAALQRLSSRMVATNSIGGVMLVKIGTCVDCNSDINISETIVECTCACWVLYRGTWILVLKDEDRLVSESVS